MTNNVVLVTGGAGYIGSHVCKALANSGFLPVAYDNLCSGNAEAVKWGPFERGDIRNRARLAEVIAAYKPSSVMHFAALIRVGDSVANPAEFYDNNIAGSWCLLEEARAARIASMVFSSTAAVYGNPETATLSEDHPLRPINAYGHTKLAMENMIRDYATAYPMHYAIMRYFNAAGADPQVESGSAYKQDSHIIPLLMQVASGAMPEIKVFGTDYDTPDGTALRDYIHVTDLAAAHVLALKHIRRTGQNLTLNLGTNSGHSVRNVIDVARAVTRHRIPALVADRRAGDPDVLVANAMRARAVLGWHPAFSGIDTIVETAWKWRSLQNLHGRTGAFAARAHREQGPAQVRKQAA